MKLPEEAEVHVWSAARDLPPADLGALWETLSGEEKGRAAAYCHERDRERFVAGRGLLRAILGGYLGVAPAALRLGCGPRGKPFLEARGGPHPLRFNVSHAGGLMLVAVAWGREVGIDVERLGPLVDAGGLARTVLSAGERLALAALPAPQRSAALIRAWTRKEAVMKALGLGAALDPRTVRVSVAGAASLLGIAGGDHEACRWSLRDLDPGAGYTAALAAEGADLKVSVKATVMRARGRLAPALAREGGRAP